MKQNIILFSLLVITLLNLVCRVDGQITNSKSQLRWFDAEDLCVEGKGWTDTGHFYDRLPLKAKGVVRKSIWELSHDSPGICIRFVTDATSITARWSLRNKKLAKSNMPASGVSGLDLYVRYKDEWRWLGAARPDAVDNEKKLTTGMAPEWRECMIYLPLFNGIEKLEIGLPAGAKCELPPSRPANMKPVVFYGTSIVQGGAASRPGMAYPAILCRRLDCTMINLGFAGNALCETEIAELLAELNPAAYVLDPLPNMNSELVKSRMTLFIDKLREVHPKTPIVLVENTEMGDAPVNPSRRNGYSKSNAILRNIFAQRVKNGDKKLYYVRGEKLLGTDGQGTVDRVHPSDLGFMRMADGMESVLKKALRAGRK